MTGAAISARPAATREQLQGAGLRATAPRLAVLDALLAAPGHHTADEVAALVAGTGTRVARMSIYNTLETLAAAGLILRADAGPGATLYELATVFHHHFVCRRCGAILDVPCATGRKPCLDVEIAGAAVDEAQIIFRGVCASCQGQSSSR